MDERKIKRRTSKTRFNRQKRVLEQHMAQEDSIEELTAEFQKLEVTLSELQDRHDEYCETIADTDEYEQEEEYIQTCLDDFMEIKLKLNQVRKSQKDESAKDVPVKDVAVLHDDDASQGSLESDIQPESSGTEQQANPSPSSPKPSSSEEVQPTKSSAPAPCKLRPRLEKPKLPTFSGDVRDYYTFKDDFKHMIDPNYEARDAVSILRNSLNGKPLELLKGIGTDYAACWDYLDMYYGDPKVISDAVAQDLTRFKALTDGEDGRFCEFSQLVRRSFNILKQVGKEADMNNNHMLALIEKKMTPDDRKVFTRMLQQNREEASLRGLLKFLEDETKTRRRTSASIRSTSITSQTARVHVTKGQPAITGKWKKCWGCETDSHWPDQCPSLLKLTPEERLQKVKDKHACFACMKKAGRGHNMNTCSRKKKCSQCDSHHHHLLHIVKPAAPATPTAQVMACSANSDPTNVALPLLTTEIGALNKKMTGNIVFDCCASVTLIREAAVQKLGLQGKGKPISIDITTLGGMTETHVTKLHEIKVYCQEKAYKVSAVAVPEITTVPPLPQQCRERIENHLRKRIERGSGEVDILLGVDHPAMHGGETEQIDGYILRNSPLGWVILGSPNEMTARTSTVLHIKVTGKTDLSEFWSTEAMGVKLKNCNCEPSNNLQLTPKDREQFDKMWESCEKVDNRWLVPYPWKRNPEELPDNRKQAMAKLMSMEKKLQKEGNNAQLYDDQMKEMEQKGFSRKLSNEEMETYDGPVHYISHHPVIRPDKKSTPVRIVFNASASFNGHRLNDYWEKGPDLLNDLFGVLFRFRQFPIAVSGDIAKMYHQIRIPERDKHVHRFLWRSYEDRQPDVYVKEVVTFGDMPAPAMALTALKRTAAEGARNYPEAARALDRDTYMDDICTSTDSVEKATRLTDQMDTVLNTGGFKVKDWVSNAKLTDRKAGERPLIGGSPAEEQKVLGVVWNPETDRLKYQVKAVALKGRDLLTKRMVLSELAKVFDPIGFSGAFLIKGKILMQKLWQLGVDWDDDLRPDIKTEWRRFFTELESLNGVSFERCLMPKPDRPVELIVFSDASEEAFGAVAYTRCKNDDGTFEVRFIAAKSRVSPLKCLTIPRLELQAAVLASRLYASVAKETSTEFARAIFLSDSVIVLSWIRGQSRQFKPFVSNRVAEIQSQTDPSDWRHIPGEFNIADKISRGVRVQDLQGSWRDGPEFLREPEEKWPKSLPKAEEREVDKEKRTEKTVLLMKEPDDHDAIDCSKFSRWRKLIRVTAYVFRFISNLKAKGRANHGPLTVEELTTAENHWLVEAQKPLHERLKKGEFKSLSPFVKDGMILVGGRGHHGKLSYDRQHPALLPRSHHVSYLITKDIHERGHYGVATTTTKVRSKYWVIGGTSLAKTVKYRCVMCRVFEHKPEMQYMASLPSERMAPFTPPFYYTACDYFGPFVVKVGRNKTAKNYGVIFTCLNTRAVHLEVAVDCSTMEFLQVLRRFLALRGHPKMIQSDNGTQFVGAERQLREMVKGWNVTELKDFCAERQICWKFTTPLAPHQNGCAEALVKSCKQAFKKAIGEQRLTPFELQTCLQEVANLVNERPIGRHPTDPDDGSYICPNDILLGRASNRVPHGPFRTSKNPRDRFEFVQQIVTSFWKTWIRDVHPALVPRKRWSVHKRDVRVGDIVALAEPSLPRGKWNIGRITEVYPGQDGHVRNVKVKTVHGDYSRPITKIAVIYPVEGYE